MKFLAGTAVLVSSEKGRSPVSDEEEGIVEVIEDNCTHPRQPFPRYNDSCDFVHAECEGKAELYVCMQTHPYMCTCVHADAPLHVHTCACRHTLTCAHVRMQTCPYMCTCVHADTPLHGDRTDAMNVKPHPLFYNFKL